LIKRAQSHHQLGELEYMTNQEKITDNKYKISCDWSKDQVLFRTWVLNKVNWQKCILVRVHTTAKKKTYIKSYTRFCIGL
jgi:hypothetical protein